MTISIPKKVISATFFLVIFVIGIAVFGTSAKPLTTKSTGSSIATINVKAGYLPHEITLPANKENSLRFVTNNTYDCSASILIPKLKVEQLLPPTGAVDVSIPPQSSGTEIIAGCAMGMYTFKIKFL